MGFGSLRHLPLVLQDSNVSKRGQRINAFPVSLFGELLFNSPLAFQVIQVILLEAREGLGQRKIYNKRLQVGRTSIFRGLNKEVCSKH